MLTLPHRQNNMRVDQISELTAEDLSALYEEYTSDTESIINVMNELIRVFNILTNRNISLGDNVDCDTRSIPAVGGSEIRILRRGTKVPRQIVVGRVGTTGTPPTSAVQILDWTVSGSEIIVSNIVGLTSGQSYTLTLTVYY